jgi:hypothetical protein
VPRAPREALGAQSAQAASPAAAAPSSGTPFAISATTLASIVARPETFLVEYRALGGGSSAAAASVIRAALGPAFTTLSDTGCMAVYASIIAFNAAPQGDPGFPAMNAKLTQLLSATALTSAHYCKLATLLALLDRATLCPPDLSGAPVSPPAVIHFLLWTDTLPLDTGYHSQLLVWNALTRAYLLLDPMYAFALAIPYGSSGPQPGLTDIENAATFLSQPLAAENLVLLDASGVETNPTAVQYMTSGSLGPQYIYHGSIDGSEAWDARIAHIIANMS